MKVFLFIVIMCLFSAALLARDLAETARKERARRLTSLVSRRGKPARVYTNTDLERFQQTTPSPDGRLPSKSKSAKHQRDYEKERQHWRKEKEEHQRETARLDARIRRLEWRLAERRARKRPGERLREDPAEKALEESLKSMQAERTRFIEEFLERGRKAGAFPGWLR